MQRAFKPFIALVGTVSAIASPAIATAATWPISHLNFTPAALGVMTGNPLAMIRGPVLDEGRNWAEMARLAYLRNISTFETAFVVQAAATRQAVLAPDASYSAVFGSVSIPFANLPAAAKWKTIRNGVVAADFSCTGGAACKLNDSKVAAILKGLDGKSFQEKLNHINNTVNRLVRYTPDSQQYGRNDYWAAPGTTLALGRGDCEDYAILKMALLRAYGVPADSMSVVVVKDTRRNLFHAILAVSTSKGHFILDNLRQNVPVDVAYSNYQPLYSLSSNRSWIHGRKVGSPNLVSGLSRMDATPG